MTRSPNTPDPADWPTAFKAWSGTFEELVRTADAILRCQKAELKPLTPRLARHYIQQGLIGRGVRQGRKALFQFSDLEALIHARQLVTQGVSLKTAAGALYSNAPEVTEAPTESPSEAVTLIRQLLQRNQYTESLKNEGQAPASFVRSRSLQGHLLPQAPPSLHEEGTSLVQWQAAPGCTLLLDPQAWGALSPLARTAAQERLARWLHNYPLPST